MSVAKVTEITSASSKSFEDAIQQGIERAAKTIRGIQSAWVQEQKIAVVNNKIKEYRVNMKITFLLDTIVGLISIEQNAIIKIFSVAAVAFMPPTLVASIYGMNFEFMPELAQEWGYPVALGLMVLSAVIPLLYFRKKGWF